MNVPAEHIVSSVSPPPFPRRCPACDAAPGAPQGAKNGFELLRCHRCATLYTATVPARIGSQDYDPFYAPEHLSVPAFIDRRLDQIVAGFSAYRRSNRLLDVGFGSGALLQAAARAGWQVEGVELSETAVARARGLGLSATCGDLLSACYPNAHFDVVTASEVVEHVPQPRTLVQEVARVLRPGGLFWATTPQSRGLSARLLRLGWSVVLPPEHLQLFSPDGLRTLLSLSGFGRIGIDAHGTNPFELVYALKHQLLHGTNRQPALFMRVASSQHLNEFLTESPVRRTLKDMLNGVLSLSRLGDTLKVRAVK